jgi:homoserine/homoserine lactone efflux protein
VESVLDFSILALFIPTFFFVSVTPGMCMTLAMSLGMSVGLKRTFFMMAGELLGVAIVAFSSVVGVAAIMVNHPQIFTVFKYAGGVYLGYLGIQMWMSRGKMALSKAECPVSISARSLALQGFITAIANPKGWAFFIALLPPFIHQTKPLLPQISVLLAIILTLEFLCLILYASGGNTLRVFLQKSDNVKLMNRVAGTLMMGVGVWLAYG